MERDKEKLSDEFRKISSSVMVAVDNAVHEAGMENEEVEVSFAIKLDREGEEEEISEYKFKNEPDEIPAWVLGPDS